MSAGLFYILFGSTSFKVKPLAAIIVNRPIILKTRLHRLSRDSQAPCCNLVLGAQMMQTRKTRDNERIQKGMMRREIHEN
jgi:hypothetical protein